MIPEIKARSEQRKKQNMEQFEKDISTIYKRQLFADTEISIQELTPEDFTIYSGKSRIELGSLFDEFTENHQEKEEGSDYVGEIYKGDQPYYKVYVHNFEDFDLYPSNLNYDVENRDFSTYIIQQITLLTPVYETNRGIAVGSGCNDVVHAYSEGRESYENENRILQYSLDNRTIAFTMIQQDIVDRIVLNIQ